MEDYGDPGLKKIKKALGEQEQDPYAGMDPSLVEEYKRQQKVLGDIGTEASSYQDIANKAAGRVREVDPYYQKLLSGELGAVRSQAAGALAAGQAAAGRGAANYGNILATSLAAGQKEAEIGGQVGAQKYAALTAAQSAADQAAKQALQAQEKYSQAALEAGGLEDIRRNELERADNLIAQAMAAAKSEAPWYESNKSYAARWLGRHLGDVRTKEARQRLLQQFNDWGAGT